MSRPYELSDGRYKCRSCGKKFSWTSVWDSVRLSSREKTRLLDARVLTSGEGLWTDSAHEKRTRAGRLRSCQMADALKKTVTDLPVGLWRPLTWDRGRELSDHACFTYRVRREGITPSS